MNEFHHTSITAGAVVKVTGCFEVRLMRTWVGTGRQRGNLKSRGRACPSEGQAAALVLHGKRTATGRAAPRRRAFVLFLQLGQQIIVAQVHICLRMTRLELEAGEEGPVVGVGCGRLAKVRGADLLLHMSSAEAPPSGEEPVGFDDG